jgi:GAF domain-containing protein
MVVVESSGPISSSLTAVDPAAPGSVPAAFLRTRRILEARNFVFERIAMGAPLVEILTTLTRTCEDVTPDVLCSVLLLDAKTLTLHHGAAPSLPEFYCKAIDGAQIGPAVGSCGSAAYLRERVIVEDVLTHPYWVNYWRLAESAGLRACWSEPVFSSKGEVLGTFAMYYAEPRRPTPLDLDFIRTSAHVAGVAIERARTEEELEHHRHRLEELVRQRTEALERANAELRRALDDVKRLRGLVPSTAP